MEQVFRTPPRNFEEEIRKTLLISKLKQSVSAHIIVTESEIKEAYKYENEQATISYLLIEPKEFESGTEIDTQELADYYKEHSQEFKTADKVNVEYIVAEYSDDQTRTLAEEMIWAIREDLSGANTFETVARKYSLPIKETGYFSREEQIPEIGWSYPFANTAFELDKEKISEIIETPKGYCILRLKERKAPYIPSFNEVSEKVEAALRQKKAIQLAKGKADEYLSRIKESIETAGINFEDIAQKLSLEIKKTEPFTRNGYIPEIGQTEALSSVFNLEINQISNCILTPKGYCILRLDALQPVNEEKFLEEKAKFKKKLLIKKKNEYYRRWLKELRTKANLNSNLEKIFR